MKSGAAGILFRLSAEGATGVGTIILLAMLLTPLEGWGSGRGDIGDPCASVLDCQAQGRLYCDQDEHVCKQWPMPRESLPIPPGVPVQGCKTAADCAPGWECTGYMCIVNAHGCTADRDCSAHQVCVPDHPELGPHGICEPEDVAKKLPKER